MEGTLVAYEGKFTSKLCIPMESIWGVHTILEYIFMHNVYQVSLFDEFMPFTLDSSEYIELFNTYHIKFKCKLLDI